MKNCSTTKRRSGKKTVKSILRASVFWGLLTLLALTGCEAQKAYDKGSLLLDQKRYEEAVVKLTEAAGMSEKDMLQGTLDGLGNAIDGLGDGLGKAVDSTLGKKSQEGEGKRGLLGGLFGKKDKQVKQKTEEKQVKQPKEITAGKKKKPQTKYVLKLKEAKEAASKHFFELSQKNLSDTDLLIAKENIQKSIKYASDDSQVHIFSNKIDQSITQVNQMREEVFELSKNNQWDDAIMLMNDALLLFRSMPNKQTYFSQLKEGAYKYFLGRSKDCLIKDDRLQVETFANKALSYLPSESGAKQVLQTLQNRNKADEIVESANAKMEEGEFESALNMFGRAYELFSTRKDLPGLIVNAKERICDKKIQVGHDLVQEGNYAEAIRRFQESKDLLANYREIDDFITETFYKLSDEHHAYAVGYREKELYGNAILHDAISLGYRPGDSPINEEIEIDIDIVKERIKYVIGFAEFKASDRDQELANTLDATALQHLNRAKPANVIVMDRANLESVLDGLNLSAGNIVDSDFSIQSGKLEGVDAIVVGKVLENRVAENTSESYKTSTYFAGYDSIPNPEYNNAVNKVNTATAKLNKAQSSLSLNKFSANLNRTSPSATPLSALVSGFGTSLSASGVNAARNELATAQSQLAGTPRSIQKKRYEKWRYPVLNTIRTCKMKLLIKMIDSSTGSIIFTDQITGDYSKSDSFVQGDGMHNVLNDPLELPSNDAMAEMTLRQITEKLKVFVELASKMNAQKFFVEMQKAQEQADQEQAVENCINYLFAYPTGHEHTNDMLHYLKDVLSEEIDLIELENALQKHCHVAMEHAVFPAQMIERDGCVWITQIMTVVDEKIKLPCTIIDIEGRSINGISELETLMAQYGVGQRISVTLKTDTDIILTEFQL